LKRNRMPAVSDRQRIRDGIENHRRSNTAFTRDQLDVGGRPPTLVLSAAAACIVERVARDALSIRMGCGWSGFIATIAASALPPSTSGASRPAGPSGRLFWLRGKPSPETS
jgi:hypothetical protein